jgi:drug/metabolite transporter (DMT)-like permease
MAYFLLGELLKPFQYLGFILVLGISFFLSSPNFKKFRPKKSFLLMLIASLLYAVSSICQKYVYDSFDFWSGYILVSLGMALAGAFFGIFSKKAREFLKDYKSKYFKYTWIFIASESFFVAGVLFNSLALSKGPVSLVKVIEGVEPVFILLLAILFYPVFPKFLREAASGGRVKKLALMGVMLLGLYFINL